MSAPATTRRVTPTAMQVLPADAEHDVWLAKRREGIGSSDVAAILGVADQKTGLHVFHDKRGELVDDAGEAALWGRLLEEPVAREWARRNRSVIQRVGLVANVDEPWQMVTLDRRVLECPLNRGVKTRCALEVKTRNAFTAPSRWHADIPDDVLAQTAWQMAVTGFDHIHVAVLIGGNDYRQTVVRADEQLAGYIVDHVAAFRRDHLLTGTPPPADLSKADALNELDELMHPDRSGEIEITELMEVLEYVRLAEAESAAKKAKEAARAVLALQAKGARYVMYDGNLAYELGPTNRPKVDLDALAEQFPDAYAACVTTKTSHTLRIASALRGQKKGASRGNE